MIVAGRGERPSTVSRSRKEDASISAPSARAVFIDYHVLTEGHVDNVSDSGDTSLSSSQDARALYRLADGGWRLVIFGGRPISGLALDTGTALLGRTVWDIACAGGRVDRIYCCTDHPEEWCGGRMPCPGLLLWAVSELCLNLASSHLITDAVYGLSVAETMRCVAVFLWTSRGALQLPLLTRLGYTHVPIACSLGEAVDFIMHD